MATRTPQGSDTDIAASQVKLLTKLPAPSTPPPALSSGTVVIFRDENWNGVNLSMDISTIDPNWAQLPIEDGTDDLQGKASWIAFNLPVGAVMTFMASAIRLTEAEEGGGRPGSVTDLSFYGRCVDLVGTGQTEGVDLRALGMQDSIAAFFWRNVDFRFGAIELFQDGTFSSNRSTIFLSEWTPGTTYNITNWYLWDQVTSVRWSSVPERVTAVLFADENGSGSQFTDIKGYIKTKEVADLSQSSFNDAMSSFRWDAHMPIHEVVAPFKVQATADPIATRLTGQNSGTNNSAFSHPVPVTTFSHDAQTVTISTQDNFVTGISATIEPEESVVNLPTNSASHDLVASVVVNFNYTPTATRTTRETITVPFDLEESINAPPHTTYTANLLVTIGTIPQKLYTTMADRWYDVHLPGTTLETLGTFAGLFKRTETVHLSVSGSFAANFTVSIQATPVRPHAADSETEQKPSVVETSDVDKKASLADASESEHKLPSAQGHDLPKAKGHTVKSH